MTTNAVPLPRRLAIALAAGAAVFAVAAPGGALAADYCVADSACVAAGGSPKPSIESAIAAADGTAAADRVLIGAGTFATGPYVSVSANPLEIIGKGAEVTTLTAPADTPVLLSLNGASKSVSDLRLKIPVNVGQNAKLGLSMWIGGTAKRITINADPGMTTTTVGADLENGATLADSTISLPTGAPQSTGVQTIGGNVFGTKIRAHNGAWLAGGAHNHFDRDTFDVVNGFGVDNRGASTLESVSNSLFRLTGSSTGIRVNSDQMLDAALTTWNNTIVGDGSPGQVGVAALSSAGKSATVLVDSSIIRNTTDSLLSYATSGSSSNVTTKYSDYDPASAVALGLGTITTSIGNINADPLFAGPDDFHLRAGSPAIDGGTLTAYANLLDLDGNTRFADGDGDGTARRDMGAFEVQTAANPPASPAGTDPGQTSPTGQPASGSTATGLQTAAADRTAPVITRLRAVRGRFRFNLSEAATVRIVIQRRQTVGTRARYVRAGTLQRKASAGAVSVRFSGRIGSRALRPGRYRAVVTARDAAANRSRAKTVDFRIVKR